jgi:hypothetical protein
MGVEKKVYRVFMGKRPLGRPRRRWKDNIKETLEIDNAVLWM